MISVQDARILTDGIRTITVYRDFDDEKVWYIVPRPRFARQMIDAALRPAFSLVEYRDNTGSAKGTCHFTVELQVDEADRELARSQLGPDIQIGQLAWTGAAVFLGYPVGTEQRLVSVTPSNYDTQAASFVLVLETSEELNAVKDAFDHGAAGVSPFSVDYQVSTLAQLHGVKATVKYDSTIAFEYDKEVHVSTDTWGNETSRSVSLRENLRQSEAGSTEIEWYVKDPSPEFAQRVQDWAWATLERLVQKAMDDAMRFVGDKNADHFDLTAVGSFARTYTENQVIDWLVAPQAYLPAFSPDEWKYHYTLVENRRLVTSFTLLEDIVAADIRSVTVTVQYGERPAVSHEFLPGEATSWAYSADGVFVDKQFVADYKYRYRVVYGKGVPYESEWISTVATSVGFAAADLGFQTAAFTGSNIDFDGAVDFVLIDFAYTGAGPLIAEQKKLTGNGQEVRFLSHSFQPGGSQYNYALTYVLKDPTVNFVAAPTTVFPPQNRDYVHLYSQLAARSFSVTVRSVKDQIITDINLVVDFEDLQNPHLPKQTRRLQGDVTGSGQTFTWEFSGSSNATGGVYRVNGEVGYADGKVEYLRDVVVDGRSLATTLNLRAAQPPFTVSFDPVNVDWAAVKLVTVDAFRVVDGLVVREPLAVLAADKTDVSTMELLYQKNAEGKAAVPRTFYTFNRQRGTAATYYYEVAYYQQDGSVRYADTREGDATLVVLPRNGTSSARVILTGSVPWSVGDEPRTRPRAQRANPRPELR